MHKMSMMYWRKKHSIEIIDIPEEIADFVFHELTDVISALNKAIEVVNNERMDADWSEMDKKDN